MASITVIFKGNGRTLKIHNPKELWIHIDYSAKKFTLCYSNDKSDKLSITSSWNVHVIKKFKKEIEIALSQGKTKIIL